MSTPGSPGACRQASCSSGCASRRTQRSMQTAPESPDSGSPTGDPGHQDNAAVEEQAVWLEVNGQPTVTWMCTPELLEELAVGWLHGEGYITDLDQVRLRPCATDLGFWAEIPAERMQAVAEERRRPVLASG
ncbi:MAG: hypothetical protein E4H38_01640, partial [Gemmatimonadales bacterium]